MAQFLLGWDNTDIQASENNTSQRVFYRQKVLGGDWLTGGFTPANDLPKTANNATSPVLTDNIIYEFKVNALCTTDGPIENTNGPIDQIGFACIVPTVSAAETTSTISLDLTGTDITKVQFTLRNPNNTIKFGPTTVNRVGNTASLVALGLTGGSDYYWQAVLIANVEGAEIASNSASHLGAPCGPYPVTTEEVIMPLLAWVPDQYVCEREGGFTEEKVITEVSSPARAWYDSTTNRVYIADHDNLNGNVYWFNPDTATTGADMTHSLAVRQSELYNAYIDGPKRRIYFVGGFTGGLVVYNIDTDTASVVPFGVDVAYSRITLTVGEDFIYCNDRTSAVVVINRHTLVANSIPTNTLTNPTHFNLDTVFVIGNNKLFVVNGNNVNIGTIGVYSTDLTTHLGEIALPGAIKWGNVFWQTGFYDKTSGKLFIGDIGSSKRYVINHDTHAIIHETVMGNKLGKSNVRSAWITNPITDELLYSYRALNTPSDPGIGRTYLEDRETHSLLRMFESQSYNELQPIAGTNKLIGVNGGSTSWTNPNGPYNIDGTIQILNSGIVGFNTGKRIITTLKEVDLNRGSAPTGRVKNNVIGQPDYIQPAYNTSSCPLTYTTDCPTDLITTFAGGKLEWEFSLTTAVRSNPNIAKVVVCAYNNTTASIEGAPQEFNAPFNFNYFGGSFNAGLTGTSYTIKVKYLNASGVELQNC